MVFGTLLATLKFDASTPVPSAATRSSCRSMPVTREAMVPSAMIRLARDTLVAGALAGASAGRSGAGMVAVGEPGGLQTSVSLYCSYGRVAGPWIALRRGGIS